MARSSEINCWSLDRSVLKNRATGLCSFRSSAFSCLLSKCSIGIPLSLTFLVISNNTRSRTYSLRFDFLRSTRAHQQKHRSWRLTKGILFEKVLSDDGWYPKKKISRNSCMLSGFLWRPRVDVANVGHEAVPDQIVAAGTLELAI